jgi:sugar O-acyltransferase (sialic acid O-acetyltransferase NeuD family)
MKKIVIYGSITLMKMLYYDARDSTDFEIAAFVSDPDYCEADELLGIPWITYDMMYELYPAEKYDMLAIFNGYRSMRARDKIFDRARNSGYKLRNYISRRADFAEDVELGENNIIMGNAHIGFGGVMGDNNLIRQGVYLGHQFNLGNNNIITAGCNIGGHSKFENNSYIGLGVTIIDHIKIAEETLIGAGSVVIRDTEPYSKNAGSPSRIVGYHREEGPGMKIRDE